MVLRIKDARMMTGMTQEEFAEFLGINQTTLSTWERGLREPKFDSLIKIVNHCNVSLDWLFGRTEVQAFNATPTPQEVQTAIEVSKEAIKQPSPLPISDEAFEQIVQAVAQRLSAKPE